jgi:GNAT superfamily N-acetyltransferase
VTAAEQDLGGFTSSLPEPEILPAASLTLTALRQLFNAGYSDYLRPLQLDEAAFAEHMASNEIDLECSCVLVQSEPVAFALIALRGSAGWIGGVASVPAARRQGFAGRVLASTVRAAEQHGGDAVWLEVIDANRAALGLYEKLGFEVVRDVIVWTLPPGSREAPEASLVPSTEAQAWIAAHRPSREPWQRSDETVAALSTHGPPLVGMTVDRGGAPAGAVLFRCEPDTTRVLQIAARDDAVARDLILAAAGHGDGRPLRLSNAPLDEPPSRALEQLGADALLRQHEMRRRL